jgi:prepilin-type N-terminal cleavage/methylation domain-containing protein
MRARRAFTLLELLIVVGVLVALSAIVLPYGTQLLDSQSFERTVDDTMSQAMSARAWAQREGAVVELVVTDDGTRIEVRAVDLLRQAEDGTEGAAGADGMESALRGTRKAQRLKAEMERRVADVANRAGANAGAPMGESGAGGDGGFEQTIHESWASRELEFGMHAGTEAPSSEAERAMSGLRCFFPMEVLRQCANCGFKRGRGRLGYRSTHSLVKCGALIAPRRLPNPGQPVARVMLAHSHRGVRHEAARLRPFRGATCYRRVFICRHCGAWCC